MQTFYTVYVVDKFQHLIGTEAVTQLLLAKQQTFISEMMNPDVIVQLIWIKKRYQRLLSNTTWFLEISLIKTFRERLPRLTLGIL